MVHEDYSFQLLFFQKIVNNIKKSIDSKTLNS